MSNAFSCSISRLRVVFFAFLAFCTIVYGLDKKKYIPLDEITRGMEAYCLTVYEGAKIERFEMEVISVVYSYKPGQNMILVVGKDERFKHSGPVQGCSGSPVYIDGRMAGALRRAGLQRGRVRLAGIERSHQAGQPRAAARHVMQRQVVANRRRAEITALTRHVAHMAILAGTYVILVLGL